MKHMYIDFDGKEFRPFNASIYLDEKENSMKIPFINLGGFENTVKLAYVSGLCYFDNGNWSNGYYPLFCFCDDKHKSIEKLLNVRFFKLASYKTKHLITNEERTYIFLAKKLKHFPNVRKFCKKQLKKLRIERKRKYLISLIKNDFFYSKLFSYCENNSKLYDIWFANSCFNKNLYSPIHTLDKKIIDCFC